MHTTQIDQTSRLLMKICARLARFMKGCASFV